MKKKKIKLSELIETVNEAALEASLADAASGDEIQSIYDRIAGQSDACGIEELNGWSRITTKLLFEPDKNEQTKQQIIAFSFDYLQQSLKLMEKDPDKSIDLNLFEREIEGLEDDGKPADVQSVLERFKTSPELLSEFIQNTRSMLEDMESSVLALEKNGMNMDTIHSLFRLVHTLKSEANMLGLTAFGSAFHKLEDLMEKIRSGVIPFGDELISLLLDCGDNFKKFISLLETEPEKAVETEFSRTANKVDSYIEKALCQFLGLDPAPAQPETETKAPEPDQTKQEAAPAVQGQTEEFVPTIPELDLSEGSSLLSDFIEEAREHLEKSEEAILLLESNPEDSEAINQIFRAFHTIKGATGFLNLCDMKVLAHTSETMLDLVRNGTLHFDSRITDLTLASIDQIRTLLDLLCEQLENGNVKSPYLNVGPQIAKIEKVIGDKQKGTATAKPQKPLGEIMVEEGIITDAELDQALERQKESETHKKVGQILTEMQAASAKDVNRAVNIQAQKIESSIKVNLNKVDELVDLVGELVISETQVIHNPLVQTTVNESLKKNVMEMDRILRQLQETAMTMRLVPVKATFQKMSRIIRDLSKKTGKNIDIILQGEDTEIDKNMVELVSDPLIHMVRNAADHGIEGPDKRLEKGKNPTGTIILAASQKGGNIVIEIKDDGAGLNRERILNKAMEKGIIGPNEHLSDKRIWNLIFAPGFSTAEKVTDVSGRGVGMDVVRKNVEQLRGKVEIDSTPDKGSVFSIHLPVTLAIIEGIILRVGRERYILPISSIVEFSAPDMNRFVSIVGRGEAYKFHDEICPAIFLDRLFDVTSTCPKMEDKAICLFDSDFGRYCLVVDEVLTQQQVVIKNLGSSLTEIKGVSGGAILGDGRVGLILDVNGIVNCYNSNKNTVASGI